jgi:hypothetical protein
MPASGFIDLLPRFLFHAISKPFLLDGRATFDECGFELQKGTIQNKREEVLNKGSKVLRR